MTLVLTLLVQGSLGAAAALIAIRLFRDYSPSLRLRIASAGMVTFLIPIPFKREAVASPVASATTPILLWIALAGVAIALLRLLFEAMHLRRVVAATTAAPESVQTLADELALGMETISPRILVSSAVLVPFAIDRNGTAIVLPRALAAAPRERLEGVLLHELAHLRHNDLLRCRRLALFRAILWFHPLAALLAGDARAAMEERCDDLVLKHAPESARVYAETLVDLAATLRARPPIPAVAMASAEMSALAARLRRMGGDTARHGWLLPAIITAALLTAALVAAPRIVDAPSAPGAAVHAHFHEHHH